MKKILNLTFLLLIVSMVGFSQNLAVKKSNGIKPALLVIDIQNVYLPYIPEREKEMGMYMINEMIDMFRKNNCPIIRIYHQEKENGLDPSSEQFAFPKSVIIKPDDPMVIKHYGDAFNKTELDKILKEKGCNTVFLCGLSAVGCVLATYNGARNHDYNVFFIKDAIMSHNSDYTDDIEEIFGAVNDEMVKLVVESAEK